MGLMLSAVVFAGIFVIGRSYAGENVRKPVVSGQFYPGDQAALKKEVDGFLKQSKSRPTPNVRALIVPHAGYPYSGQVAAEAYETIKGDRFDSVIVIGFSHRTPLEGVYVDVHDFYETPLGRVPVDKELANKIRDFNPVLRDVPVGGFTEHSVEVQVPFLQETVRDLKIVPIYMGAQTLGNARILSEAIAKAVGDRPVLVVASSDLSHYYPYDTAVAKDKLWVSLVEEGDLMKLALASDKRLCEACGIGPVMTVLLLRQHLGWNKPALVRYANSGDVTGDHKAVVGYAAMEMTHAMTPKVQPGGKGEALAAEMDENQKPELTAEDKKKILEYVRAYLEAYYANSPAEPVLDVKSRVLDEPRGVFVTLKKHGMLRGCVGRIVSNEPVRNCLKQMTMAAALHDGRFRPVSSDEVKDLDIHVSFLTPLAPIASYEDIRLGTDGIVVKKGWKSGVFLPEVATETGWDRETFFKQCAVEKAGLSEAELKQAQIFVFQSDAFGEEEFK